MVDIVVGDPPKHDIRLAAWWLRRKYAKGKSKDEIHDDMMNCGNPVIASIMQDIRKYAGEIKQDYHKSVITDFVELLLWIIYRDTAYRDPFFYILKHMLDKKDELMPMIMEYYKEPDKFYVNAWTDSLDHTDKLKKEGKLTYGDLSEDENMFVPQVQHGNFKKILGQIEEDTKKERRRRGWY